jgi:iron complex outermembrane receptor protein
MPRSARAARARRPCAAGGIMRKRLRYPAILAAAAAALPAAAQSDRDDAIEEIIVTAQKREQNIEDVPLAVSAFTPQFLERANVQDFGELFLFTPGFSSSPNYSYHIYSAIRGISSTDFGFGTDPSIGFYVNGVHMGRYGTQVLSYYDIERVEVVRGPQNTLFGRSSIAGAISVTTQKPIDRFEAWSEVGFGNLSKKEFTGVVNLPAGEGFALRAAGYWLDKEGFVRNLNRGDDLAPSEIASARLSARYVSGERFDATLVLSYEDRGESGNFYARVGLPDFVVDSTLRGDENKSEFEVADATLDLRFTLGGGWSLASISNFRQVEADYAEDYDGLAQVIGGPYYQNQDVDLFNQELRFTFAGERGLTFIAGASFFDESMDAAVDEWVDTTFAFTGTFNAMQAAGDYSNAFVERGEYDSGAEGWSVFADASFPLTDRLTLTGGVRYNDDTKDMTFFAPDPAALAANAMAPFPCGCYLYGLYTSRPLSLERSWSDTAFRAALDFDFTDTATGYLSWSQGWKAGGIESFKFDLPPGFPLFFGLDLAAAGGGLRSYDPEKSDSLEIGLKGSALGRRVRYALAAYSFRYEDLQRSVFNGATAVIENIGEAEGQGFEAEAQLRPDEHWELFATFAYTDTEITEDATPAQVGLPLNRAPEIQYALGVTYGFDAPWENGGRIALGATYAYQDELRTDNSLVAGVEDYALANVDLSYTARDERFEISAYVDNVADELTYHRRLFVTPFVLPVETRSVIGKPREYGVSFRYRFADGSGDR